MTTSLFGDAGLAQAALFLADVLLKGALLLAVVGAAAAGLRHRASAAARHQLWLLGLLGLGLLPALSAALPQWQLGLLPSLMSVSAGEREPIAAAPAFPPVLSQEAPTPSGPEGSADALPTVTPSWPTAPLQTVPSTPSTGGHAGAPRTGTPRTATAPAAVPEPSPDLPSASSTPVSDPHPPDAAADESAAAPIAPGAARARPWLFALLALYLLGLLLALLPLLLGHRAAHGLRRRSTAVDDPSWPRLLDHARRRLGLTRPVELRMSDRTTVPLAMGLFRFTILLPAGAEEWTPDRRRVVLLHELAHIQRRDCLTLLAARFAAALHWPNPLAWFALRRLAAAREQACDDRVLACGTRGSDYAEHLLQVALAAAPGTPAPGTPAPGARPAIHAAAIAMARRSTLEGRLLAVLDGKRNRKAMTRLGAAIAAIALAAVLIPVACIDLAERADHEPSRDWVKAEVTYSGLAPDWIVPAREFTVTDPLEVAKLASHYPRLGQRKRAGLAAGWIAPLSIVFYDANGKTVSVASNPQPDLPDESFWRENQRGDYVMHDPAGLVALVERLAAQAEREQASRWVKAELRYHGHAHPWLDPPREFTISDPPALAELASHFPRLGQSKQRLDPSFWESNLSIAFHDREGATIKVEASPYPDRPDESFWSENGPGDYRIHDPAGLVAFLQARAKDAAPWTRAEIVYYGGGFELNPQRLTLDDPATIAELAAFFPNLGESERPRGPGGGWIKAMGVTFHRRNGQTVEIGVSHEWDRWAEGLQGTYLVRDPAKLQTFVEKLMAERPPAALDTQPQNQEPPAFDHLSVTIGATIFNSARAITINGDGAYRYRIEAAARAREPFPREQPYEVEYRLKPEHVQGLAELLATTPWPTGEGAREPAPPDAPQWSLTLTQGGEQRTVHTYQRKDRPHEPLLRFLSRIDRQERLFLTATHAERQRVEAARDLEGELSALQGEAGDPGRSVPYGPVLDYHRLMPAFAPALAEPAGRSDIEILAAIRLARQLQNQAYVDELEALAHHDSLGIRAAVAEALAAIQGTEALPTLRAMLPTTPAAAWAMIELGEPAVPTIVAMIEQAGQVRDLGDAKLLAGENLVRAYLDHWDELREPIDPRVIEAARQFVGGQRGTGVRTRYYQELLDRFERQGRIEPLSIEDGDSHPNLRWRVVKPKEVRLIDGWFTMEEGVGPREHGGTAGAPGTEEVLLSFEFEQDGLFRFQRSQRRVTADGEILTANESHRTPAVDGADFHWRSLSRPVILNTDAYQTLWQGWWVRDGRVIKEIVYAARLAGADADDTGGFGRNDPAANRVLPLPAGEEDPAENPAADSRLDRLLGASRRDFHGLDLTTAPRTQRVEDLPDLWEQRPPGSGSFEIRAKVEVVYSGGDGTVYDLPRKNQFYVQADPLSASTLTYYGPFEGNPAEVLRLERTQEQHAPDDAVGPPPVQTDWSAPVEGVQVRVRARRGVWREDEIPELRWDVRNVGERQFLHVGESQRMAQLEVDGVWHVWPVGLRGGRLFDLPSGQALENQRVAASPI